MIEISWKNLTIFEMWYLLSNCEGYVDGDKKCVMINAPSKEDVEK